MGTVRTDWWILGAGVGLMTCAALVCWQGIPAATSHPGPVAVLGDCGGCAAPAVLTFCGLLLVFAGVPKGAHTARGPAHEGNGGRA